MLNIIKILEWFSNINSIRKLLNKVKQTSIDFCDGAKEYRNLPSELKEARDRISLKQTGPQVRSRNSQNPAGYGLQPVVHE